MVGDILVGVRRETPRLWRDVGWPCRSGARIATLLSFGTYCEHTHVLRSKTSSSNRS